MRRTVATTADITSCITEPRTCTNNACYEIMRSYLVSVVNSHISNAIIHNIQQYCGIDENGIVRDSFHAKFWYYYFQVSSSLVDEAISLFPLVFVFAWPLAKCLWTHVLLFYISGQLVKELFCLPRPQTLPAVSVSAPVPIAVLDKRYATESGFPSTHTSASCLPFVLLYRLYLLYGSGLSNCTYMYALGLLICILFTLSVATSRLYLGVHSLLDIAGGYAVACSMAVLYAYIGSDMDYLLYESRSGPTLLVMLITAFVLHYPQPQIWSISCGVSSSVFGLWLGFSSALLYCNNYFPQPLQILQYISLLPLPVVSLSSLSPLQLSMVEEVLSARAAQAALLHSRTGRVVAAAAAATAVTSRVGSRLPVVVVLILRSGITLASALGALELIRSSIRVILVQLYYLHVRFCSQCNNLSSSSLTPPVVRDVCGMHVPVHKRYCVDIPYK